MNDIKQLATECASQLSSGAITSEDEFLSRFPELRDQLVAELRKRRLVGQAIDIAQEVDDVSTVGPQETVALDSPSAGMARQVACPECRTVVGLVSGQTLGPLRCDACQVEFTVVDDAAVESERGRTVAHFQLESLLGRGGFGSVWRAYDTKLDRYVAIKLPRRGELTEAETEQFIREARAAAQLSHPNIVSVLEVGQADGAPYIACDLIEGHTLSATLEQGPLPSKQAAEICRVVAEALESAHAAGVIHRDLKPSNILLNEQGIPFVADFGLAKRSTGEVTITADGQLLGTPAYMPPEQAGGRSHEADGRSDVYSLGGLLYHMLTGETCFHGTVQALIHQAVHANPARPRQLNRNIPTDLETICQKCLEKKPEHRYQTAAALAADLGRWQRKEPILARPLGPVGRLLRWSARKPAIAALAAALFVVGLLGVAGVTWQWRKAEAEVIRADRNKENAWGVIDEFLTEVSIVDLPDEAQTGRIRKQLLTKAADYLQKIAVENPDDPEAQLELARAIRRLAQTRGGRNEEMQQAIADMDQVLNILRELAGESEVDSDQLTYEIALSHLQRGRIVGNRSHEPTDLGAFADLEAAATLMDQLVQRNPESMQYRKGHADAALKLAVESAIRQQPDAVGRFEEAVVLWQAIADDELGEAESQLGRLANLENLASALLGLSNTATMSGDVQTGIARAEQASDVLTQALELSPKSVRIQDTQIRNLLALGYAYMSAGRNEESIDCWKEGLRMRTQMATDFPEVTRHRVNQAIAASGLAYVLTQAGRGEEAIGHIQDTIALREQLLQANPEMASELRIELMRSRYQLAEALAETDEYVGAIENYLLAIELGEQEPESIITAVVMGLAMSSTVACFRETGDEDQRLTWANKAVQHWREADQLYHDPNTRQGLAEALRLRTELYRDQDQLDEANESLALLLAATTPLEDDDGTQPTAHWTLGNCKTEAGATLLALGQAADAVSHLEAAQGHYSLADGLVSVAARVASIEQLVECYETLGRSDDAEQVRAELESLRAERDDEPGI